MCTPGEGHRPKTSQAIADDLACRIAARPGKGRNRVIVEAGDPAQLQAGVVQNLPVFWVAQVRGNRRPVRAGFRLEGCPVREAASLPRSSSLVLKRPQAQQGEPVRMALAGHQFPWAFAAAFGN